jgi:hypothetical protein
MYNGLRAICADHIFSGDRLAILKRNIHDAIIVRIFADVKKTTTALLSALNCSARPINLESCEMPRDLPSDAFELENRVRTKAYAWRWMSALLARARSR